MKIKEILVESFKSPFFNLLAIANLCLVSITFAMSSPVFMMSRLSGLAIALNLPALAASWLLTPRPFRAFALVPPAVYLQWIFIGAFAKFIASRMRPPIAD